MHKDLTKVFNGEPLKIEMIDGTDEFMVDISGIATKNNVSITNWSDSRATLLRRAVVEKWNVGDDDPRKMSKKELLSVKNSLRKKANSTESRALVEVLHGDNGCTKIHNSMLVSFARFLSVDFEIWCDNLVYDLLTGKKQLELENQTKSLVAINNLNFKGEKYAG